MKNRSVRFVYLFMFGTALFLSGCTDLSVENFNRPDAEDVLATSSDLIASAGDGYRLWHNAIQEYSGPALSMAAMADETTCSWSCAATKDLSLEPRKPFINSKTYTYAYVTRRYWRSSYSTLTKVNDVLRMTDGQGIKIFQDGQDVTGMIRGWCYFVQGVVHGYLGLIFDQAFITDWNTDLGHQTFSPYPDVSTAAMAFLNKALDTLNACHDFVLPDGFIRGYNLTRAQLIQLVNSYAARILAYTPRTAAQTAAVDWEKVLAYAQQGIDWTLEPSTDDKTWTDIMKGYGSYPGFVRIDHRIINLMDHDYPSRWPNDNIHWNTPDGKDPGPAVSDDKRLESDFDYEENNNFRPERGYYFFSHYRYKRYDDWLQLWVGPSPTFRKWENDLLIAEALVRARHDIAGATAILNDPEGARKARGGLPDVAPATEKEVLRMIFDERGIELVLTQGGTSYFDMRRTDRLQAGTILHYPVPAAELEIIGYPNYTTDGPDDLSKGCWKGYDGLVSPVGADCDH